MITDDELKKLRSLFNEPDMTREAAEDIKRKKALLKDIHSAQAVIGTKIEELMRDIVGDAHINFVLVFGNEAGISMFGNVPPDLAIEVLRHVANTPSDNTIYNKGLN